MARYLLFLREDSSSAPQFSPEELQAILEKYQSWSRRMRAAGKVLQGEKLRDGEGRVLRQVAAKAVLTDGPFVETKEVVGGYFMIEAKDYEEALAIASECPHMEFGSIEVREIEPT